MKKLLTLLLGVLMISCSATETPIPENYDTVGIDISHHQGDINWHQVDTYQYLPIAFIYMKATEGETWVDPKYHEYLKGAQVTNIPIGSYHYYKSNKSVDKQFENFISTVDISSQDLVPVVDIEECTGINPSQLNDSLHKFLDKLEAHYGVKPMLYTGNDFYNEYLQGQYEGYPLWIARYSHKEPVLVDSTTWGVWQHDDKGYVAGISEYVDINIVQKNPYITQLKL